MITVEKALNNLIEELGDRWVITGKLKVSEEVFLKSYKTYKKAKGILYNATFDLALEKVRNEGVPAIQNCIEAYCID